MNIQELIAHREGREEVTLEGLALPAGALKHLLQQGYENIVPYRESQTFSVWGKNRSACFTREHLLETAGSE